MLRRPRAPRRAHSRPRGVLSVTPRAGAPQAGSYALALYTLAESDGALAKMAEVLFTQPPDGASERLPSCLSPYHRGACPPPPASGGSGLRVHSTPLPPPYHPALPLIGASSVPPASMHPPLPHDLTLLAPYPLHLQTTSPGLHLLLPSRRLPPLSRTRPRGPTLQAPPSPQPQTSSLGLHLLSPLQCPQVRTPLGPTSLCQHASSILPHPHPTPPQHVLGAQSVAL